MSPIFKIVSALSLGAMLSAGSGIAQAGLVGTTVSPIFYADIPSADNPVKPDSDFDTSQIDDDTHGLITIANGTSFSFHDYFYEIFGTFMTVTFTDTQIILTNLVAGIFPEYTAADFSFVGSSRLVSVSVDPSSDPEFSTLAQLLPRDNGFRIDLSNTCATCFGVDDQGHTGERIVLNVAVIPEPATVALFAAGALTLMWRRRKARPAGSLAAWIGSTVFGGRTASGCTTRPA